MPVVVESDAGSVSALLRAMPTGSHAVTTVERMLAWLDQHPDEFVAVLGPSVALSDAQAVAARLRTSRPTVSVVLVRDALETSVLAAAMKAGARDVVAAHDDAALTAAVRAAYELFTALRGPGGARHVGRVVTVFSPKGGVGKTTVAANLALALTQKGAQKVCLVDLDLAFGDVAITMQLFPTHTIEHAIGAETTLDLPQLEGLLTRHQDSLMVLAAPGHPDTRERITPALLSRVLAVLREGFDHVVVDTAPAFDEQTLSILDETDEVVLVATLDVPTLKNVKVALETLDTLDIAADHRHLLLNRADDAVGISHDKVEAILGMPVAVEITSSLEIAAATNAGVPIVAAKPQHAGSRAMAQLAGIVSGRPVSVPEDAVAGESADANERAAHTKASRGLFGRRRATA